MLIYTIKVENKKLSLQYLNLSTFSMTIFLVTHVYFPFNLLEITTGIILIMISLHIAQIAEVTDYKIFNVILNRRVRLKAGRNSHK